MWFHVRETSQNQWFWNALAYTRKNPQVVYTHSKNETISKIPKVVSFQRNITKPMLSATRFSIQATKPHVF